MLPFENLFVCNPKNPQNESFIEHGLYYAEPNKCQDEGATVEVAGPVV